MPLIIDAPMGDAMNNEMAVDLEDVDLFGDPVLAMHATRPPSKQLQQRMDELRTRGCCQSIAWSRQGTIASISRDGRSIELRLLRTHPDNASWDLSEPTPCTLFSTPLPGGPIVHLAWAATGSPELAVIDAFGRVCILTFSITLNRPYVARKWDADPADDLHTIVGSYWLPLVPQSRQYNVLHGPAVREANSYKYESSFIHAFGPWHPNPAKSALLCVTTNGVLKLFYSQNNNKVEETQLELESVTTSDDLISHAAICSDRNALFIAMATASKQLRVVRATINWGIPQSDKQMPPASMPLSPSLKEKHAAVTSWFQHDPSESHLDSSMPQLSHLEVLPSILDTGQSWSPPVVLGVRSYIPAPGSPYNQELQSIVDRWEILIDQNQTLHPAFEQLGSRTATSTTPPQLSRLRKLESIVINKVIVTIQTIQLGKVICFAFSDGTVQYRDRLTMNEIYNEVNTNSIMILHQVGFQFAEENPCLQVAFSPTNCSFIQMCEDGKVKWVGMRYPLQEVGSSMQDPSYASIIAGLTVAAATAAFQQIHYDDILAVARTFADKPRFTYDWIMEIVRMLKINVDYSEEAHHDQLVRNAHLQLCLSVMNHLGFKGEFQPRTFAGKFSMLALNVRNIVILITIASNTPINLKEKLSPLDEPEVVDALAGCAKWALDLLSWLTDCLFNLLDDPKFMALLNAAHFSEITSFLHSKKDVSLHLLLCSSTRGFLSASCRRLLHLESISNRAIQYYENKHAMQTATDPNNAAIRTTSTLHTAYLKMQRYTTCSLIKVQEFDKLLQGLSAGIRSAYQTSLAGLAQKQPPPGAKPGAAEAAVKRAQIHCELNLLLAASPQPSFLPVVKKFFETDLKNFRNNTDPASLFFANFELLEVEDDRRSLAAKKAKGKYIDVFKRIELTAPKSDGIAGGEENAALNSKSPQWRRCVRCASIMEDAWGTRPGFTFVLAQQRKCSCGGNWGLLPKGALVC